MLALILVLVQAAASADAGLSIETPWVLQDAPEAKPPLLDRLERAGSTFAFDSAYLATSPLRPSWQGLAWLAGGAAAVALVKTQDEDVRDFVLRHPNARLADASREADRLLLPKYVLPCAPWLPAVERRVTFLDRDEEAAAAAGLPGTPD